MGAGSPSETCLPPLVNTIVSCISPMKLPEPIPLFKGPGTIFWGCELPKKEPPERKLKMQSPLSLVRTKPESLVGGVETMHFQEAFQ